MIRLYTELTYFAQLLANLSRRSLVSPQFTVKVLNKLLVERLEGELVIDCVRDED